MPVWTSGRLFVRNCGRNCRCCSCSTDSLAFMLFSLLYLRACSILTWIFLMRFVGLRGGRVRRRRHREGKNRRSGLPFQSATRRYLSWRKKRKLLQPRQQHPQAILCRTGLTAFKLVIDSFVFACGLCLWCRKFISSADRCSADIVESLRVCKISVCFFDRSWGAKFLQCAD